MERRPRYIAAIMLVVFAFFYCGNTLFLHTHTGKEGHRIVHSHPYFPNAQHTHSSNALWLIALSNATVTSAQHSGELILLHFTGTYTLLIEVPHLPAECTGTDDCTSGLDPPSFTGA